MHAAGARVRIPLQSGRTSNHRNSDRSCNRPSSPPRQCDSFRRTERHPDGTRTRATPGDGRSHQGRRHHGQRSCSSEILSLLRPRGARRTEMAGSRATSSTIQADNGMSSTMVHCCLRRGSCFHRGGDLLIAHLGQTHGCDLSEFLEGLSGKMVIKAAATTATSPATRHPGVFFRAPTRLEKRIRAPRAGARAPEAEDREANARVMTRRVLPNKTHCCILVVGGFVRAATPYIGGPAPGQGACGL